MHGPILAEVIRPSRGRKPGVCQLSGARGSSYGFFVPYQRVGRIGRGLAQCEAVIKLFVQDLSPSSSFSDFIPFAIDTGTDVTIIPRNLVSANAFPVHDAVDPYTVSVGGLTGGAVFGRTFRASLAIIPPVAEFGGLGFNILTIVVVDYWVEEYAMLGLDAIRRVVMVSDHEHVSFWPLPAGSAER